MGSKPGRRAGKWTYGRARTRDAPWVMVRQITSNSVFNHTDARWPLNARDPCFAFWPMATPTAAPRENCTLNY